ncbi:MAG: hypothetical protein KJS97_15670 [Alphaproteobacteria bacterium]|nr:hypothetical protein [Alphaproteobacteria bacterium]
MDFSVYLRLTWDDEGRLACVLSDWSGPLDERLLSTAEAIAAALDKIDSPYSPDFARRSAAAVPRAQI